MTVKPRLREHLARLFPGEELVAVEPLAADTGATKGSTEKAVGYGLPVRVVLATRNNVRRELVWRTAATNEFGHDRRGDRAGNLVQAYDDFAGTPNHVTAIDVGFVDRDGALVSIKEGDEPYLITTFAPGTIYADDLRRIAATGALIDLDIARVDALARYLATLHAPIADGEVRYRRAVRDLIGSGEGIYGIVDGYPRDVPCADETRLRSIEERCGSWRWRFRNHSDRLTRTHGDFHPFNIVFDAGSDFTLLDASRGACSDPADDLTALAVNFLLFAADDRHAWKHALSVLWHRWWTVYGAHRDDPELLAVAPPFFAWRALVVCNPRFYPKLSAAGRDKLLGFAEDILDEHYLDPHWAGEVFG